jgi:glycine C-acetyltransferase
MKHILIIGATGQIGSELTMELRKRYGNTNVVAGYIPGAEPKGELKESGPAAIVDVTNGEMIASVVKEYHIDTVYNLAALLSVVAESKPKLVMVDESHSAGVVGATGHGVSELYKTHGRVDIYTGTLGKAFGGALGGFTTGRKEIIDLLRQRSRPYLFSNSLAPGIIGASLEVFKILKESNALHDKLVENVNYFRDKMTAAGFDIKPTQSAICAVMLYDAKLSQIYAARMQEEGIYVTGFYYPVVPKDQARIRVQISAGHEKEHLDKCIAAFIKVGKELGVLK